MNMHDTNMGKHNRWTMSHLLESVGVVMDNYLGLDFVILQAIDVDKHNLTLKKKTYHNNVQYKNR